MTTFVFPGQGSQFKGMGSDLFDEFDHYVQKANDILGYDLKSLCLEDLNSQLNLTNFTQPAIFVVNALSFFKRSPDFPKPSYVAGHSLGEYNALLAAEVFDFETGLKLVKKRGELMSQIKGGAMLAVIGLKSDEIQTILNENNIDAVCIGNFNSYTQVVLSGMVSDIQKAKECFEKKETKVIPLKVSGAFHSSNMHQAKNEFYHFIGEFHFNSPKIEVIANLNARPYPKANISMTLADQIDHPVYWTQSIEYLLSQGEDNFVEMGEGKILSGLINRIKKGK